MQPSTETVQAGKTILEEIEHVAAGVNAPAPPAGDVFVHEGAKTAGAGALNRTLQATRQAAQDLRREPLITLVEAVENGERVIFLVTRNWSPSPLTPLAANRRYVAYKTKLGQLAEASPGSRKTIETPRGARDFDIVRSWRFVPDDSTGTWDARDNEIFERDDRFRIISIIRWLEDHGSVEEIEAPAAPIIDGILLPDVPIVDEAQGLIFRQPVNSRIILTGAPGTGKTTTLIKRISQKSQLENIRDEVSELPEKLRTTLISQNNWVFFAPTELLRLYLKQALSVEGLAAPDERVRTWATERTVLAREVLGILRVGQRGVFLPSDPSQGGSAPYQHHDDFIEGFYGTLFSSFRESAEDLDESGDSGELARRCKGILERRWDGGVKNLERDVLRMALELESLAPDLTVIIGASGATFDEVAERVLEDRIASGHHARQQELNAAEESAGEPVDPVQEARRTVRDALRVTALAAARDKPVANRFAEVTNDFVEDDELQMIGRLLIRQKAARTLRTSADNVLRSLPQGFRRYLDRARKNEDSPAGPEERTNGPTITGAQLDVLVLAILRGASFVFSRDPNRLDEDRLPGLLGMIRDRYTTQVVVDEATDFSAVQLACMYELADPRIRSVSFCGDLMQRVTDGGIQDWNECDFIADDFDLHQVSVAYRQTPRLLEVASALYREAVGNEPPFESPYSLGDPGPPPIKYAGKEPAKWISRRLVEIFAYRDQNKLPSTAVFVARDSEIGPCVEKLRGPLSRQSMNVVACPGGQALGAESEVRVFSVEHIKGLQFEAVFFYGVNRIAEIYPALVDRFLYVGVTRAARFLAATYTGEFPQQLQCVAHLFGTGPWGELSLGPSGET